MNQIIPLTTAPNQQVAVTLSVNGKALKLNLTIRYREIGQYWIMEIADVNRNILLADVPLLTGDYPAANILGQYEYMNIGSACVLNVSLTDVDYPDSTNLGTNFALLWSDNVA